MGNKLNKAMLEDKITKDHILVVTEGFEADKTAYDLIDIRTDIKTGLTMKKIKYINGDKVKWCARIVQEVVITKGLTNANSRKTDEDYYFFECKEIGGNGTSMNLLVSSNYIQGIIDKGQDPHEIFAKGEEVYSESFYVEVNGKFYPVSMFGFEITDEAIVNVLDYLKPEPLEYHTSESFPPSIKIEEIRNKTHFNNDKKNIYETDDDLDNLENKSRNSTNFEDKENNAPKNNKFLIIVLLIISFVFVTNQIIGPLGALIGDMAVPIGLFAVVVVAGFLYKVFTGFDG